MKIKSKLFLGIGSLFALIAVVTALSTIFINKLSADTKNILAANYNSIDYSRRMLNALNGGLEKPQSSFVFTTNLTRERENITETGEKELTVKLSADFENLVGSPEDPALKKIVFSDITDIILLNMQAIQRKGNIAADTAESAILWITLAGTICLLIALTILFNLPGIIANPIKELTTSIKEIAAQNYSQRVNFEQRSEFGELASSFNTMAQKLEEYKASNLEKLFIEKKRIETLINNMTDPVIGLDENNKVLFMNNNALKIAGLSIERVIGKPVGDISMQNDLLRALARDLFELHGDENPKIKSMPVKIYADNKESYFEKQIIPIKIIPTGEKEEKQIGNVILLQNITPYKELDFARTNFIATVSHELKTPISSIKMSLQLLENRQTGTLNPEQINLMESIREDSERLLKITSELLNMTEVENGSIPINIVPCNANEIIDYAISATRSAAEQKQIRVEIKIPADLPQLSADIQKTSWVLTNLISNAIRYSYDNSIVYLEVGCKDQKIKFSVSDSGQGISSQYVDKIFDRYFRIPGTKREGTGLGLSISKEFIEAQGGQISVESDFGAGSSFTFSLKAALPIT